MKPTCTSRLPRAASASTMRFAPSAVVASGFSQKQGLPAAMAASTYCSCVAPQEVTSTASTLSEAIEILAFGEDFGIGSDVRLDGLRAVEVDVGERGDPGPGSGPG